MTSWQESCWMFAASKNPVHSKCCESCSSNCGKLLLCQQMCGLAVGPECMRNASGRSDQALQGATAILARCMHVCAALCCCQYATPRARTPVSGTCNQVRLVAAWQWTWPCLQYRDYKKMWGRSGKQANGLQVVGHDRDMQFKAPLLLCASGQTQMMQS